VADHSEGSSRLESSTEKLERGVLRARDVIPYGHGGNEGKVIIPKFELSRELMAGQRKTTAEKRQRPGDKAEPPGQEGNVEAGSHPLAAGYSEKVEADEALAEIVARDIARLCGTEL